MITQKTLNDVITTLTNVTRIGDLGGLPAFPEFDEELVAPVIEEAGKLAEQILTPLNQIGDKHGATLVDGGVLAAPGFKEAYNALREGGWIGLSFPEAYGGQGLPSTLAVAVMELIQASNMAFSLCPMLTFGAIEALLAHGTPEQQQTYLPKLVSGEWTGTMNLTEPQAGSDVGALKTKAEPNADGSYAITGQKIFITWGDHDMTDNIIHLVLARLPDAPPGSKGISLFLCPKFLLDENGTPGERNAVRCIGLEHKLGIHASPTCVMEFDGATGFMVGEPNRGLAAMFTMMNSARLQVGIQGVSQSEAAYQTARIYADERKQGFAGPTREPAEIIKHADVQRMLLEIRAKTMASRAICYECARSGDLAKAAADEATRRLAKDREDILTPIAKAWSTDVGVSSASLGVQVFGGMGFMGETLASQIYRDARIAPIYEGTNGIQAIDLVDRKVTRQGGAAVQTLFDDYRNTARELGASDDRKRVQIGSRLMAGIEALEATTRWILETRESNHDAVLFSANDYLDLFGRVAGVHYLARGAMTAANSGDETANDLAGLALYLAESALSGVESLGARVRMGELMGEELRMSLLK